jgi:drug/metabolite transporter (DMT)-like permease
MAVILFRVAGRRIEPIAVSFSKNVAASALLLLTLVVLGRPLLPPLPAGHYLAFFLSGFFGIALSDTLLFVSLDKLGAELFAIVDCSYVPFVIGLSYIVLGERITPVQAAGVVLIVIAVALVSGRRGDARIAPRDMRIGISAGLLAMLCSAVGIVIMKPLLAGVSMIWVGWLRTVTGAAVLALVMAVHRRRRTLLAPLREARTLAALAAATVLGSYFSMLLWLGGMQLASASIASALNQMNTIFIFILAAVFLKERITPVKAVAVALAFAGALIVSLLG